MKRISKLVIVPTDAQIGDYIELLYDFGNHVKNVDEMQPLQWGIKGIELLSRLEKLNKTAYKKNIKKLKRIK